MTSTVLIQHQGGLEKDVMVTVHQAQTGDVINEHRLQAGKGTQISLSVGNDIVISEVDKLPEQPADDMDGLHTGGPFPGYTPPEAA